MFGKKESEVKQNVIHHEDGTNEFIFEDKNKCNVKIKQNMMTIEFKGASNALTKGLVGTKILNIDYLMGIQFKEPTSTVGYIQLIFIGYESKGGVTDAVKDENSITFTNKDLNVAYELRDQLVKHIFR